MEKIKINDIQWKEGDIFTEDACKCVVLNGDMSHKPARNADGDEIGNMFFLEDSKHNHLSVLVMEGDEMTFGGKIYLYHVDKNNRKWFKTKRVEDLKSELMTTTFGFLRQPQPAVKPATKRGKKA